MNINMLGYFDFNKRPFTAATYNLSCGQFSNGRSTSMQNYRRQIHSFL